MCELTKHECYVVANLIDSCLIHMIVENPDACDMYWLRDMMKVYEKVCAASGYIGLEEELQQDTWDFECRTCKFWTPCAGRQEARLGLCGNDEDHNLRQYNYSCTEWERRRDDNDG